MRIHCDACNAVIDQDQAVLREDDDGEVFYFCDDECAAAVEGLDADRETERLDAPPR